MASNSPNPFTTYCPECVAAGRTEWACSATADRTDPTNPELVPVKLTEALTESSACAAPCELMEGLQVTPLVIHPCTALIIDCFSPFYSVLGYKVTATYRNMARLISIGHVEPQQLGREARLTAMSEIGGIPLRLPIDAMIDVGDMLYLLSSSDCPVTRR